MGAPGHLPPVGGGIGKRARQALRRRKSPTGQAGPPPALRATSPTGRPSTAKRVRKREALGGFSLAKSPQTPQMRLKHGVFRHLRMAAKGAALGTRHLLKKVDENFGLRRRRTRGRRRCRKNESKSASGPRDRPRRKL